MTEVHENVQFVDQNKRKTMAKNCDGGEPSPSVKKKRATDVKMAEPAAGSAELRSPLNEVDPSDQEDIRTNMMLNDFKGQLTVMLEKMSHFEAYIRDSKLWMECIGNMVTRMEKCMDEYEWCERRSSDQDESEENTGLEDEADDDRLSVKAFRSWHDLAIKSKPYLATPLPLQAKTIANAPWFYDLMNPKGWLNDDHVDVLLNLIIFKSRVDTDSFLNDWTMLEMMGTGILMQENFELVHNMILSYVKGEFPREGARSWVKASRVIAVANINENHWICLEISFVHQCITVYDSKSRTSSWSKVKEALENMTMFIPWLCKQQNIWEEKGLKSKLRDEWRLVSFKDAPQQCNDYDCGIMAIKFAECLVSSHDINAITTIDPELCGVFRNIFCGQLYHLGLKQQVHQV